MTEKEKMMAKKLYDANYDETLNKERMEAKDLCYEYNQLRPSDEKNQKQILYYSTVLVRLRIQY